MEFRIVLDEKNSDSSLGTSPPTDIDTDSEAKKKKKEKWKYIRLPIKGLAAGRKLYQSHSWRAKTTFSKLVEFSHIPYKRGLFDDVQNYNHLVCPTPMGH